MLKGKCQGMGDWPGLGRILFVVSWNQNLPEVLEIFSHPCNQLQQISINRHQLYCLRAQKGSLSLILVMLLIFAKDTRSTHDFTHAQCLDTIPLMADVCINPKIRDKYIWQSVHPNCHTLILLGFSKSAILHVFGQQL